MSQTWAYLLIDDGGVKHCKLTRVLRYYLQSSSESSNSELAHYSKIHVAEKASLESKMVHWVTI